MKRDAVVLLALLSSGVAVAADEPSLAFPEKKIELPPRSLAEIAKGDSLAFWNEAGAWFRNQGPPPAADRKKYISKMPIFNPGSDVDIHMPIKKPDPSIDYKLIVKAPEVESGK